MNKEKIKDWCKDHKLGLALACIGSLGFAIGWKQGVKHEATAVNEGIKNMILVNPNFRDEFFRSAYLCDKAKTK